MFLRSYSEIIHSVYNAKSFEATNFSFDDKLSVQPSAKLARTDCQPCDVRMKKRETKRICGSKLEFFRYFLFRIPHDEDDVRTIKFLIIKIILKHF